MKKQVACAACVSIVTLAGMASAQVRGGVKGGLNLATMSFSGSNVSLTPDSRAAWMAGVFVEVPVARHVAFQPEAVVSTKGASISPGGSSALSIDLTYLDVPLLLRVEVPTRGKVVPYVYAGPNVGILLRARTVATIAGTKVDEDMKDELKDTEFGVALGAGVRFGMMLIEARYVQGLTNVVKLDEGESGKATNRVLKIIAGVRF
jgi:hypothetical protein